MDRDESTPIGASDAGATDPGHDEGVELGVMRLQSGRRLRVLACRHLMIIEASGLREGQRPYRVRIPENQLDTLERAIEAFRAQRNKESESAARALHARKTQKYLERMARRAGR